MLLRIPDKAIELLIPALERCLRPTKEEQSACQNLWEQLRSAAEIQLRVTPASRLSGDDVVTFDKGKSLLRDIRDLLAELVARAKEVN